MLRGKLTEKFILVLGDFFLLYFSLFLTLCLRYFSLPPKEIWGLHIFPFFVIYLFWVLIFYMAGFYDTEKRPFFSLDEIFRVLIINGLIAILIFYLIPSLGITPKTNLVINVFIASFLIWSWRKIFISLLVKASKIRVSFLGDFKEREDLMKVLFGYEIVDDLSLANIIIVSERTKRNPKTVDSLYQMLLAGKTVVDFDKFYESLTGKIPVSTIDQAWFLENLVEINKQTFEKFKRGLDIIFSLLFFIPFFLIYPFVALAIKMSSPGPVFYKQKRLGKNGKVFDLVKFRSMIDNSEPEGGGWTKPGEKDSRVTLVGNVLRKTRIDELPQIWNVLRGDLSFIGPRPERPEFVKELVKEVPYYSTRHIVKPGLTGWGQINFADASAKDALEKLQYDLYYIKNRSLILDLVIALKTIMLVLQSSGK